MIEREHIAGIVLAGGRSSRMEGPDKTFVTLGGQPLVARAVARLSKQTKTVSINANRPASDFADCVDVSTHPIFTDTLGGYKGPLAGVLASMRHVQSRLPAVTHIATAATDTPFFPSDLVTKLAGAVTNDNPIALAASDGHRHPVFGLWPVALADNLEHWLTTSDTMKVMAWVKPHGHAEVDFPFEAEPDPFFNINTPDDLRNAEALIAQQEPA